MTTDVFLIQRVSCVMYLNILPLLSVEASINQIKESALLPSPLLTIAPEIPAGDTGSVQALPGQGGVTDPSLPEYLVTEKRQVLVRAM